MGGNGWEQKQNWLSSSSLGFGVDTWVFVNSSLFLYLFEIF